MKGGERKIMGKDKPKMEMIPVRPETKKDVESLKLVEGEIFDSVIKRLVAFFKEHNGK